MQYYISRIRPITFIFKQINLRSSYNVLGAKHLDANYHMAKLNRTEPPQEVQNKTNIKLNKVNKFALKFTYLTDQYRRGC